MKRLAVLFALLLLGAEDASKTKQACTPQAAVPATIGQIAADWQSWIGKCVTIEGIEWGFSLLTDREALIEEGGLYGENAKLSMALYPDGTPTQKSPRWVRVTGEVGSCALANAEASAEMDANPGTIIMVSGYCHTSLQTYLSRTAIKLLDRPTPLRLTEADVPPDLRIIVPAPADLPGLAQHRAAAAAQFQAIERGDRKAFASWSDPELRFSPAPQADEEEWLTKRRVEASRSFSDVRKAFPFTRRTAPQSRSFVWSAELADWLDTQDKPETYYTCWCRTADCTGKWPVVPGDIDNLPARPYYCIETGNYVVPDHGTVIQAKVPMRSGGFAEPVWPRIRRTDQRP